MFADKIDNLIFDTFRRCDIIKRFQIMNNLTVQILFGKMRSVTLMSDISFRQKVFVNIIKYKCMSKHIARLAVKIITGIRNLHCNISSVRKSERSENFRKQFRHCRIARCLCIFNFIVFRKSVSSKSYCFINILLCKSLCA